ncbi:MAG: tol-pal system protein YbgF [Pseudomonadota bacterium]
MIVHGRLQKRVFGAVGILAGAMVMATAAEARPSTKERVETLEGDVAELKAASEAAATSSQRVIILEEQVRALTGQIEILNFRLQQSDARIQALSAALAGEGGLPADFSAPSFSAPVSGAASSSYGASAPSASSAPSAQPGATGGPAPLGAASPLGEPAASAVDQGASALSTPSAPAFDDVQLPMDPEAAFIYANSFLLEQDYARAENAYTMFLDVYGGHPRAEDAQFRLGEIYLARDKNAEAADAFVAFIRKYPKSGRLPEAYFKLGASFSRLGQKDEACKVFNAVKKKYPNAPSQLLEKTDRERARNGCQ